MFDKLNAYLNNLQSTYSIPECGCIITQNHKILYSHMFGFSDASGNIPASENDLFFLYSATKIVTMTAIMQLIEKGKISLYDELEKYLPEYSIVKVCDYFEFPEKPPVIWPGSDTPCHYAKSKIRIIDLMTMTSGLSYDINSEPITQLKKASKNKASTRRMISAIAQMPLIYEPGTRWLYGLSHDVLGAIVEVVTGEQYSSYLKKHIFDPLNIQDLHFHITDAFRSRLASQYSMDRTTRTIIPIDLKNPFQLTEQYESGGAGLIGSLHAYSKILEALANGGTGKNGEVILKEKTVQMFCTSYLTGKMIQDFSKAGKKGYSYGFGVRVLQNPEHAKSPIGEFGWDGAGGAYALVDIKNKISIFYVQHVVSCRDAYDIIHPAIRDLVYEELSFH